MSFLTHYNRWRRARALHARRADRTQRKDFHDCMDSVHRSLWKLRLYAELRRLDEGHRARMMVIERAKRALQDLNEQIRRWGEP